MFKGYQMRLIFNWMRTVKLFLHFFIISIFLTTPIVAEDLSNWMKVQAQKIPGFVNLTLTQIAMPGSHDSLTFSLGSEKRAAGKLGLAVKIPLVGKAIVNISEAQGDDLIGQFNNGARYFDLRVALTDKGFEGVHGLYNGVINKSFQDLKNHLLTHSGEVVILDFQQVDAPNKQELVNLLKDIFGNLIYPASKGEINISYRALIQDGKRVIILMKRSAENDSTGTVFDRKQYVQSVWHNEQDSKKLTEKIIAREESTPRSFKSINVIQAQTTPSTLSGVKSVLKSIFTFGKKGGLKEDAKKSIKHQNTLLERASTNATFLDAINVFMVDHVNAVQAQQIIALNTLKVSASK